MNNREKTGVVSMILIAVFMIFESFVVPLNLNSAGLTVIVGVAAYFLTKRKGHHLTEVPKKLMSGRILFLILLPLVFDIIFVLLTTARMPEVMEHIKTRTNFFENINIVLLTVQLLIAAALEEIAWRGFFQDAVRKSRPAGFSVLFTALVFSICHVRPEPLDSVFFDFLFVFLNSTVFGVLYDKTRNVWIGTIAHFLSNFFGIVFMFYL